ncbi:MAG: hypothetical protein ACKPKO_24045, partial [Candidatus Fonsibacter sp.]
APGGRGGATRAAPPSQTRLGSDAAATAGKNRELLPFVLNDFPVHRKVDVEVVYAEGVQGPGPYCSDRAVAADLDHKLINAVPRRPTGEFKADLELSTKLRYHVDWMMRARMLLESLSQSVSPSQ